MSTALLRRHSSLLYSSRSCRRRFLAQSVLSQRDVEEHPATEPAVDATDAESSSAPKKRSRKLKVKGPQPEPDPAPSRSLQPTKVDIYLASLQSAGLQPSLEDLERCRPARHALPGSTQYVKEYNELMDNLSRSFSLDQLRHFCVMYELDPIWSRHGRRKAEYAQSIIEKKWMWPNLKEIERKRRDRTEVVTQAFPVTPSQLFLILGKDGSDLLQMSMEFNVHISLVQQPLSLKIEGLRGSMKLLTEKISNLKKAVIEETFQISSSSPLPQSYLQRISRLSTAFIENIGTHGKVRVCALNRHNLSIAKRLANRINYHIGEPERVPLLSYIPATSPTSTPAPVSAFRHSYSLYPFLSHRALPWMMGTGGVFRVRRVGEWLGQEPSEDVVKTGGLSKGTGKTLTLAHESAELKRVLTGAISEASIGTTRTISAMTGHVLFSNPGTGQRATLVPPMKGHWPFAKILQWAETRDSPPSFVPSLPMSLLTSSSNEQKILHRLIYLASHSTSSTAGSATPVKIVKFEIILAQPATSHSDLLDRKTGQTLEPTKEWGSEFSNTEQPLESQQVVKSTPPDLGVVPGPHCWAGIQAAVCLMMPDRPMDIKFLVEDLASVPRGSESSELQQYVLNLKNFLEQDGNDVEQPEPPASLTFAGETYELNSTTSVRQSADTVQLSNTSQPHDPTYVLQESLLDLESNQKSVVCKVNCQDVLSEAGWTKFMTDCDNVTALVRPNSALQPSGLDTIDKI